MNAVTLGGANAQAQIGPLVISELNYAPASPSAAALALYRELTSDDLEYIELRNISPAVIELSSGKSAAASILTSRPGPCWHRVARCW